MREPVSTIDYTNKDYEAFREMMIENLTETMPEYTDTSSTDAGIVILESLANGLDIISMYQDIIANDLLLETTQDRRIAVLLAKMLGYTPYNQTSSLTEQVFVLEEILDTDLTIPAGTVVTTEVDDNDDEAEPMEFITMEDLVIPAGNLGNEKDENDEYLYTVDVMQGEAISDDLLGSSNGSAYQTFMCSYQQVLVDTLRVFVETDEEIEEWSYVSTFIDSDIDENSRVFTVSVDDDDNCLIQFGNGVNGMIPPIIDNGITADYIIGGGVKSNVSANTIVELEDDIEGVDSTFNPDDSYTLGHDKEPLEEIKIHAPLYYKTRDRIVTLDDYGDVISVNNEDFFYIDEAIAKLDSLDGLKANIYYVTRAGYNDTLSAGQIQDLTDFLNERIMIGTTFSINKHLDTVLNFTANLVVNRDYYNAEVESAVEDYIENVFFAKGNFTFEDTFVNSDLEGAVKDNVAGVEAFRITSPSVNIFAPTDKEYILTCGTISITTTGGKE